MTTPATSTTPCATAGPTPLSSARNSADVMAVIAAARDRDLAIQAAATAFSASAQWTTGWSSTSRP
jgi:hypothetical protein